MSEKRLGSVPDHESALGTVTSLSAPIGGRRRRPVSESRLQRLFSFIICAAILTFWVQPDIRLFGDATRAPRRFEHLAGRCASIPPIGVTEFHARQQALAERLRTLNASAYIAEPGASSLYFANISQWHLSERPFLFMLDAKGQTTILTPAFEETRARLLTIPAASGVKWAAWQEEKDPFTVAVESLSVDAGNGPIYVDAAARYFVVEGFQAAASGIEVEIAPPEIRALREHKSAAEIALLTCANEATVLAIRAVRQEMKLGIKQSETQALLHEAVNEAGLIGGWGIVLFGENIARPHGGGDDRSLGKHDLVLIDVGGQLHGYSSDITRTFALDTSEIQTQHLEIWYTVQAAQLAAHLTARAGTRCGDVDAAAREVISLAGYGQYFTHRLGHGIGLEVHEDPYLRGHNPVKIAVGNVFSNEPGIYIDEEGGVRLEDIFAINGDGEAYYLTQAVGGPARSPWDP